MRRKNIILISFIMLFCIGLSIVSCGEKEVVKEPEKDAYSGTVLLNGFDTVEDMYKVRQHTHMQGNKWTGYSAEGKLQIVGKDNFIPTEREYKNADVHKAEDMAPRQGEGALHINYITQVDGAGSFTQLIARFARTDLKDLPVERLGGISVQIYNDNSTARSVTLSLVKSDLSIVSFGENSVTIAPYSWTECKVDLNPAIVEYFRNDVVGLSVEFDNKVDSVYYLDNLCLTFEQVHTEEITKYVNLVKELEADIDEQVVGKTVTVEFKETLTDLFKRYLDLPEEYQGIVRNYTDLQVAITKYMSLAAEKELKNTGSVTVLRFDEIFGLTQLGGGTGCSANYTTEEHAPGEDGSICVEFDGTVEWANLFVHPNVAIYDEIHVWVKNDSEFARVFNIDWLTLSATNGSAYDEDGNEIISNTSEVEYANNIIAKDGWVELVFRNQVGLSHFNFTSYATDTHQTLKSQGKFYIGKVWATSKVADLMKGIDALKEKKSYTEKELLEILDLYIATMELSKEQRNILGLDRVEKIEKIYKANAAAAVSARIKTLEVKAEYSAAEIAEINSIKELYDNLSKADKSKANATNLNRVLKKIEGYNEKGLNMDVTAYDSMYADKLLYSTKEVYSGEKFSVKYATEIKDGNFVKITLPETITSGKRLKIAVKNTSDKPIAIWPKVSDEQGGLWLEPLSHSVVITEDEKWVELVYDIEGLTIDSLLATYGPWENGNIEFYIGKMEVVTDLSKEVASEMKKLSSLFKQKEFTAAEIRQLQDLKEMYDSLSAEEKSKINVKKLNAALKKISKYDKSGKNMNVLAYDENYGDMLSYSLKEVLGGEKFSMKIASGITDKGSKTILMPEPITGKKLTITVKNTSDKDIAIWPKAADANGGAWLAPTNHGGVPIVKADEGWVELTYNISGITVDAWITTYGPWENGDFEVYIGKLEVSNNGLVDLKKELANISAFLEKEEFTATEITQILEVKAAYDKLSNAQKKKLNATDLNAVLKKIKAYNTAGTNMNVTKYDNAYGDMLSYSIKEKLEGSDFSMKLDREMAEAEAYITLPKTIYGGKKLTIMVKNVSNEDIAIWPKLVEDQGGTWIVPMNHNGQPIISAAEGWVELTYDITDMTIDTLVTTLGPWKSGQMGLYIGKIEVSNSFLPDVEAAIAGISDILTKDELTAAEMQQIVNVKNLYDNRLTEAEKQSLNATNLLNAVKKIEAYNTAGANMDITKYDASYSEMLYYSLKETVEGADFSLKLDTQVGAGETNITLPEVISGAKTLTITVKNTSAKDIAIWPHAAAQGGAWLNPTNHNNQPIITSDGGWVELTYNIDGQNIDTLVMTYGPWESGQISLYIGEIEVVTTYYPVVEEAINKIADILEKEEFTAGEIQQILDTKAMYDSQLSQAEKQAMNATSLLAAVEKIQGYDAAGSNMNVAKYADDYANIIYYSAKEKTEGANFSLKWAQEMSAAEAYVKLPEIISGADTLTITVKNISEKPVAFWPQAAAQGGVWLNPTNHSGSPILEAAEGWVTLTYDISGQNIDTLITTYGPWESGQMEFYIGSMETSAEATPTLKQFRFVGMSGGTYTETSDGMKIDFDGTIAWSDVNFETVSTGGEIHVFVKNDSDARRIVSLDWAPATKVYDENGNDVTSSVVDGVSTILPANSGWLELVYTATSGSQLNCCSLEGETGGVPQNGVGSLYIKGYSEE